MRKFNIKKFLIVFFIIFAVVFMVPFLVLSKDFKEHALNKKIAANGEKAIATVLEGTEFSNVTVNGVAYYSIQFKFTDKNGIERIDRTSKSYTIYQIEQMTNAGLISIRYDAKTFDAVEEGYEISEFVDGVWPLVLVFSIIDLIFWIVVIVFIVKLIKEHIVHKKGYVYNATFVSFNSNVIVNGVPMFSIKYSWMNDNGEFKEDASSSDYTEDEAILFEQAKTFKIKAIDDESIIITKVSELARNVSFNEATKVVKEKARCQYCGSLYEEGLNKCPICGAGRKI